MRDASICDSVVTHAPTLLGLVLNLTSPSLESQILVSCKLHAATILADVLHIFLQRVDYVRLGLRKTWICPFHDEFLGQYRVDMYH